MAEAKTLCTPTAEVVHGDSYLSAELLTEFRTYKYYLHITVHCAIYKLSSAVKSLVSVTNSSEEKSSIYQNKHKNLLVAYKAPL